MNQKAQKAQPKPGNQPRHFNFSTLLLEKGFKKDFLDTNTSHVHLIY